MATIEQPNLEFQLDDQVIVTVVPRTVDSEPRIFEGRITSLRPGAIVLTRPRTFAGIVIPVSKIIRIDPK